MKTILTSSFQKIASDYKREPGSLPGEGSSGQASIFNNKEETLKKWKRKNLAPSKRVYQLGVDIPVAEKVENTGTL